MPKKLIVLLLVLCACLVGCRPPNCFHRIGGDRYRKSALIKLRLAAIPGDAQAQYNLGCAHDATGRISFSGNRNEAIKWYRKAAVQGHVQAQKNLALLIRQEKKRTFFLVQRYARCSLAVANGHANAKHNKDLLIKKMTPEQIARGQELARELDEKINAAK